MKKTNAQLLEQVFREAGYVVLHPGDPLPENLDGARAKKKKKTTKTTTKDGPKAAKPAGKKAARKARPVR
ncbi:MAG: hypothetical protein HY720_07750 [Planctomycetes bacterium]|nr:hypothetical protein [Planctomycetota bacterium]